MAGARAPLAVAVLCLWLGPRLRLGPPGAQASEPAAPSEPAACLARFSPGVPGFVLDTAASVRHGATFLGSPAVRRGRDCLRACCALDACNLALVQLRPGADGPDGDPDGDPDEDEDAAAACFLLDCLYEQSFVCKFAPRRGYRNYLTSDLARAYRDLQAQGFAGEERGRGRAGGRVGGGS